MFSRFSDVLVWEIHEGLRVRAGISGLGVVLLINGFTSHVGANECMGLFPRMLA